MNKAICIKVGIYRYDIDGIVIMYDRENGLLLGLNNIPLTEYNTEQIEKSINEIIEYETKGDI